MAKIGDILFGIKGDWNPFEAEVTKRGAAAGQKLGDSTAKGFNVGKIAVGLFSTAAAGAFALAAKGAADLERVQGDYAAATGASTEEAKAFAAQVNGMRGSNTQSLQAIAAAGTQVAQQFQLTGEAGKELTQDFLTFARVTKQDAAGAVDSFDAALDAFGEPASRATSLMDQLVVSNQKYGTVAGPAALSALQGMAPALVAMGGGLDDGVGLLNLFEAAGMDASAAQRGLNTAVKNLPPGTNLDDVIAQLGAIEDPALRAAAAIKIFGGRSGVGLANAIKPGMTSLDDFKVDIAGAAGAADKAGDAMLTTTDKFGMFFEDIKSKAAAFGQDFGPLLMGVSSIGSLVAPMAKGLTGVLVSLARHAGILAAAGAAGAAQGTAMAAGMAGPEVLAGSTTAGGKLGSAFAKGAKALMVVGVAAAGAEMFDILNEQVRRATDNMFGRTTARQLEEAVVEMRAFAIEAATTPAEVLKRIEADMAATGDRFDVVWARIRDSGVEAFATVREAVAEPLPTGDADSGFASFIPFAAQLGTQGASAFSTGFQNRLAAEGAAKLQGAANAAGSTFSTAFETRLAAAGVRAREIGGDIGGSVAKGLADSSTEVLTATEALKYVLEHGLTPQQQRTQALGAAWGKLFTQGVNSSKPGAKEAAFTMGVEGLQALSRGSNPPGSAGAKRIAMIAANLYRDGWTTQQVEAALAAQGVGTASLTKLRGVKGFDTAGEGHGKQYAVNLDARPNIIAAQRAALALANAPRSTLSGLDWSAYGSRVGMTWGNGIDSPAAMAAARRAANNLADAAGRYLSGRSPPPEGPLRHIDIGGRNVARAWIGGLDDELRRGARRLDSALSTYQMADLSGGLHTMGATATMDQTLTVRLEVDGTNLPPGVTNAGIATATTQALDMAGFLRSKRTAVTLPVTRR